MHVSSKKNNGLVDFFSGPTNSGPPRDPYYPYYSRIPGTHETLQCCGKIVGMEVQFCWGSIEVLWNGLWHHQQATIDEWLAFTEHGSQYVPHISTKWLFDRKYDDRPLGFGDCSWSKNMSLSCEKISEITFISIPWMWDNRTLVRNCGTIFGMMCI